MLWFDLLTKTLFLFCSKEGKAVHPVTVPDTITEWNANAFCLADIGFGLSQLTTIRVFQPFFIDLTLPYSVICGEAFQIKVTVFNFLKDCIQVRAHLGQVRNLIKIRKRNFTMGFRHGDQDCKQKHCISFVPDRGYILSGPNFFLTNHGKKKY